MSLPTLNWEQHQTQLPHSRNNDCKHYHCANVKIILPSIYLSRSCSDIMLQVEFAVMCVQYRQTLLTSITWRTLLTQGSSFEQGSTSKQAQSQEIMYLYLQLKTQKFSRYLLWYLVVCKKIFSNAVMNWIARSYKIRLFLHLQIYIFTTGASPTPHPHLYIVALLHCKRSLAQIVPSEWTPRQWMLSGVRWTLEKCIHKDPWDSKRYFSPLCLILWAGWGDAPTVLFPAVLFMPCWGKTRQSSDWVGLAEKYCGSLQTMCTGGSRGIFFESCREWKRGHENDFYKELYWSSYHCLT